MLICLKINMQAEKYGYEVLEEKNDNSKQK